MKQKELEILLTRITKWYERIQTYIVPETVPLDAEFAWSKDPTPFSKRLSLDYKSIKTGEPWGEKWESAWFHLTGQVPQEWTGKTIIAELDFSG